MAEREPEQQLNKAPSSSAGSSAAGPQQGAIMGRHPRLPNHTRRVSVSFVPEMDENKPVLHHHRESVDFGVTASEPDSLKSLFDEVAQSARDASSAGASAIPEDGEAEHFAPQLSVAEEEDLLSDDDESEPAPPLSRLASLGELQKIMGASLKKRRQRTLNIPTEPKRESCLNMNVYDLENIEYLAQGAMCVAYSCILNGEKLVLKTPLQESGHFDIAANDIEVEMLLLNQLHHSNIVGLKGAGHLPDGRRYIMLEYLSGGTLSTILRSKPGYKMPKGELYDKALELANALEYLHDAAVPGRIVCHRDLKPDNIAFSADGKLKVLDFGLGKIIRRKFRVRTSKYKMTGGTGSLRYMAPEVANHKRYNEKADVYSFSLILWEMLAGVKPFAGLKRDDFYTKVVDRDVRPPLDQAWPPEIRSMLQLCWHPDPDCRLSFREISAILQVVAEDQHKSEHRASHHEDSSKEYVPKFHISEGISQRLSVGYDKDVLATRTDTENTAELSTRSEAGAEAGPANGATPQVA